MGFMQNVIDSPHGSLVQNLPTHPHSMAPLVQQLSSPPMAPFCKGKPPTHSPPHGSLVQRELSAQLTEGLSVRATICYIENELSYPLRHFVTPPLTIRGGMISGCTTSLYHKEKQRMEHAIGSPHGSFLQKPADAPATHGSLLQKPADSPPTPWLPCAKGAVSAAD